MSLHSVTDHLRNSRRWGFSDSEVAVHPSELPENRAQVRLFDLFHRKMMPEMRALFDAKNVPHVEKKRAWGIFLGTGNSFVLHIAPQYSTSSVYNPCETDKKHPMLVSGYPLQCSKKVMDAICFNFPERHRDLPPQMAFGITFDGSNREIDPTQFFHEYQEKVCMLIEGTIPAIRTKNFTIVLLKPLEDKESLSFKKEGFPLQFWTHLCRKEALNGAIQTDTKKYEEMSEGRPKHDLFKKLEIMRGARKLEGNAKNCKEEILAIREEMLTIRQKALDELKRVQELAKNSSIPEARKVKIQEKYQAEETKRRERHNWLGKEGVAKRSLLVKMFEQLERYKECHKGSLPTSYLEPTFQIAADFQINGEHIYKRFSASGHVLTGDPEIAYRDDVHLKYADYPSLICT